MGVPGLFHGPMAKAHRMFLLTVVCISLAVLPEAWRMVSVGGWHAGLMSAALAVMIAGCAVTALRRLQRIVRAVRAG
jgi:hypothetical protein